METRHLKNVVGGWVHVTNGPSEHIERVKSVAFNICDSCSSRLFKSKQIHFWILLLPCLVCFCFVWCCCFVQQWENKISSYAVYFSSFFYYMCNIFALILYIKNNLSLQFVSFFFFFASLFIYLCFWPLSESLSKLMCGSICGLKRGTGLEFSGMSSKWFFFLHVMLLMWGCPLHIV